MKKTLFSLLVLCTIFACNQTTTTSKNESKKDERSESQLKFIKLLGNIYDNCLEQKNEIALKEAADTGKVKVTTFITDTLKGEFKNWKGRVYDIAVDELDGAAVVTLMISKFDTFNEENPEFDAILFRQRIFDDRTKDKVKVLTKGDDVSFSAAFDLSNKDENGNIEISTLNDTFKEGDVFDEAMFDIVLHEINKSKK